MQQPKRTRSRRSVIIIAAVVLAVAATSTAVVVAQAHAARPVAMIDGRAITLEEIRFQMALLAGEVDNAVSSGRLPERERFAELQDRALQQSVRDAELFGLAHDHGLIPFDDYEGFLQALAAENATRADAVAAGEVVYGTTNFSPSEYYARTVTLVRTQLSEQLAGEGQPLSVSEGEVRAYFDAHAAEWGAQATTWTIRSIEVPVSAANDAACASALESAPPSLSNVESVCGVAGNDSVIDGAADIPAGSPAQDSLAAVQNLAVGETSAPVVFDGSTHLYQLVSSTVDSDAAYALYADRIRSVVVSERLDAYLDDLVSIASPETDEALLSTIKPKE